VQAKVKFASKCWCAGKNKFVSKFPLLYKKSFHNQTTNSVVMTKSSTNAAVDKYLTTVQGNCFTAVALCETENDH